MSAPRNRTRDLALALRLAAPLLVALLTVVALRPSTHTGNATSLGVTSGKVLLLTGGAPGDVVAPQLMTLQMFDVDTNGKVDRVVATFDETLAMPYSAGTAGWTLTNVPSGGTLASVAVAGSAATLTLTEGTGAPSTAVGSFTVGLDATTNGVRDGAGNRSSFAATAPADKAAPVPLNVVTAIAGSSAGEMQSGDRLAITFSELIATASLPASAVTVTEADPPGGGGARIDSISIPGVTNGALSTGDSGYINANGGSATAAATISSVLSGGLPVVFVDLTGCSCGDAKPGGPAAFAFVPAATLTDGAGNAAAGSFTTAATFRLF